MNRFIMILSLLFAVSSIVHSQTRYDKFEGFLLELSMLDTQYLPSPRSNVRTMADFSSLYRFNSGIDVSLSFSGNDRVWQRRAALGYLRSLPLNTGIRSSMTVGMQTNKVRFLMLGTNLFKTFSLSETIRSYPGINLETMYHDNFKTSYSIGVKLPIYVSFSEHLTAMISTSYAFKFENPYDSGVGIAFGLQAHR